MLIRELLAGRSPDVVTVTSNTPVTDAACLMDEHMIGAVAVVDGDEKVVGILSERDILKAVGQYGRTIDDMMTEDLMTPKVIACAPDDRVVQAILKFDAFRIRHLVVMDGAKLVDVMSMRDVVEAFSRLVFENQLFGEYRLVDEIKSVLSRG